jgi:ABC-type Fe3+ transport system permease subunit
MEPHQQHGHQQPQQSQQPRQPYPQMYPPSDNMDTIGTLFLVKGILTLIVSLLFVAYAAMGGFMMQLPMHEAEPMPFHPASIFIVVGMIGFLICVVIGVLTLMAAKYIKQRTHYTFIFVLSIINCMSGVLGILLGVFTIIDMNKPHVKAQFEGNYDSQFPYGRA